MPDETSLLKTPPFTQDVPSTIQIPTYTVGTEWEGSSSLIEYRRILQVLQKRRWTVLSILFLVVVTVMIGTLKEKPVYRAKAVVQIDRENNNMLSFKDVFEIDTREDDYLETAYKNLESRTLAYRVIQKLQLDKYPELDREPFDNKTWFVRLLGGQPPAQTKSPEGSELLDSKYETVIDNFLKRLTVNPVRRSRLVEISFDSYDPAMAAAVANTIASNYIDQNFEAKWESTQRASDWLTQQLVVLKAKLEKSEEDLQRYAKDNSILFLDEKQTMSSEKLKQLQDENTKAEGDLIQKEAAYNQVKDGNFTSVPGILEDKVYQELSLKAAELKREYSELSGTFTPEYPKLKRLKNEIDETEATLDRERSIFAQRVLDEYHAAANRKQLLAAVVAQQTQEFNHIAEKSIQYNILKRESDTNRQLYEGLLERVKEASVSAGMRASNIRIVDKAAVPASPAKPRPLVNLAIALLCGLGLGIGLAFFQEFLDNTLKTPDDVQRHLGLPALGMIPAASNGVGKLPYSSRKSLVAKTRSKANGNGYHPELIGEGGATQYSEAYRSLRTSVLLSSSGRPPRVILVTSAQPGEGKTTTVINLAVALAQLGGRVVIVDSDMRRPRVATLLNVASSAAGLSTCLAGQFEADEVAVETKIPNLYAIPCGPVPPNPAELLSSESMRQLLDVLQKKFDYVLLDSPPVLHVSDAQILATKVESVILVAHGGTTAREFVNHARTNLLRVNANLIGVVLNNVDFNSVGYDYYYRYYKDYGYGYGYAESGTAKERRQ